MYSIKELKEALGQDQFIAYYQPQYNHSRGMIVGAEALARWNNPGKGIISPAEFIGQLEESGDIVQLDLCIFEKTCKLLKK